MSLEKAIAENTAAIRELIAVMQGAHAAASSKDEKAVEAVTTKVPVIDGSPDAELDFVKDIQPKVNALIAAGKRAAVVKIRDHFGKKLSDIKPSQYAECLRMVEAAE